MCAIVGFGFAVTSGLPADRPGPLLTSVALVGAFLWFCSWAVTLFLRRTGRMGRVTVAVVVALSIATAVAARPEKDSDATTSWYVLTVIGTAATMLLLVSLGSLGYAGVRWLWNGARQPSRS